MAPVVHIIDPEADTVIILKNASARFAPWKLKETVSDNPPCPWTNLGAGSEPRTKQNDVIKAEAVHLQPESDGSGITASLSGRNSSCDVIRSATPSTLAEPDEDDVHYRVSSRHLMLASPVFKRALHMGGFEESIRHEEDGLYHINACDWDAEAFLIVMQIVHGRNKQVVRKITLELLAKIAMIEDYYLFGETLEMFKELWFQSMEQSGLPTTHCRDLVLWIWATWVFDVEKQFRQATMVAIKHSNRRGLRAGLASSCKNHSLEHRRYHAINNILLSLDKLLERYQSNAYTCPYDSSQSFQCGSFLLGALRKGMQEVNLLDPRPSIPFQGHSVEELCRRLKHIKSPMWISWTSRTTHRCNLEDALTTVVANASAAVEGLDLGSLKRTIVHGLEA